MKKIVCVILSIILLLITTCLLCSCNDNTTYIKQENINLNYNNISAGSGCWMNNDFIHSTKHNLGFDLYITDNNGRHKITTLSYSYDAQIIGEKLFYVDDGLLSGYEFFEYDLKTKKTRKIATLNAKRIYNYYFLHDALYIEIGDDDSLIKDIVAMNLKTGEQITIAKNISACGIANNQLNYITEKDSNCSIYEYDIDNNKSLLLGEFELSYNIFQDALVGVNFNSEYVAFADDKIYVYRYGDGTLSSYDFDGKINEFISYDKFAFFSANGNIYRFNFDDNSIEIISKSSTEDSYLFVGSDEEVYISFMELGGIRRYYVNGEYEDVILNR